MCMIKALTQPSEPNPTTSTARTRHRCKEMSLVCIVPLVNPLDKTPTGFVYHKDVGVSIVEEIDRNDTVTFRRQMGSNAPLVGDTNCKSWREQLLEEQLEKRQAWMAMEVERKRREQAEEATRRHPQKKEPQEQQQEQQQGQQPQAEQKTVKPPAAAYPVPCGLTLSDKAKANALAAAGVLGTAVMTAVTKLPQADGGTAMAITAELAAAAFAYIELVAAIGVVVVKPEPGATKPEAAAAAVAGVGDAAGGVEGVGPASPSEGKAGKGAVAATPASWVGAAIPSSGDKGQEAERKGATSGPDAGARRVKPRHAREEEEDDDVSAGASLVPEDAARVPAAAAVAMEVGLGDDGLAPPPAPYPPLMQPPTEPAAAPAVVLLPNEEELRLAQVSVPAVVAAEAPAEREQEE